MRYTLLIIWPFQEDFVIFHTDKDDLILNKQEISIIIRLEQNLFINKIRIIYKKNKIIENILEYF